MTPETIAIIAVGVTLAGIVLHSNREMRREIRGLSKRIGALEARVGALEQRMARLEGLFEGVFRGKIELSPLAAE